MCVMTNNYAAAQELLACIAEDQDELDQAYAARPQSPRRISQAHQAIGAGMKLAEIRAMLAIADEIRDLRAVVSDLEVKGWVSEMAR
jgi:hypothetical protein